MLVLARRPAEKIVFPDLGTSVQVLHIKPGVVKLGIEAPPELAVAREEVAGRFESRKRTGTDADGGSPRSPLRELRHLVRNRLNLASVGLALARRQFQAGLTREVEKTLATTEEALELLRREAEQGGLLPRSAAGPRPKRKALLVEDDRNECELLAGFLRLAGLEVDTAGDGADALDYLRSHRLPDVVLLDMVLPRCDGPATVRAIRGEPALAGLKVFGVTGHSCDRFHFPPGPQGIDRWFQKPLNPEALLRDLEAELGGLSGSP